MPDTAPYAQFNDLLYRVVYEFSKALLAFLQRDSFLYWPFLLSTVLIAMLAWHIGYVRNADSSSGWRGFFRHAFSRDLWWHPSARADYRFYLVNAVLFPLLLGPLIFNERTVSELVGSVMAPFVGSGVSGTGSLITKAIYTVAFFIAYDFGRFTAHCLLHDVPMLWEFHKVHHSAEVLTPLTSFRAHPVDLAFMAWVPALTTGIVTWLFHRFVDAGVGVYTFLGLHVLIWAFSLIGNLRHWQIWISYGAVLNRWLISPAHHQIHHSAEARHWGCNRGFELAIWDRMFGTLYVPSNHPEIFKFGLGDDTDGRWRSLGRMYFWPFALCFKRGGMPARRVKQ